MSGNDNPVLVYTTCPSLVVAEEIGGALVEAGLCACVNIFPRMVSLYEWQGKVQREEEVVVIVKTTAGAADLAIARMVALHPYDTPAALTVPVVGGSAGFLSWITEQTRAAKA